MIIPRNTQNNAKEIVLNEAQLSMSYQKLATDFSDYANYFRKNKSE